MLDSAEELINSKTADHINTSEHVSIAYTEKLMDGNDRSDNMNSELDNKTNGGKPSFKETRWRYLMLCFACCFLMGSYFCYDNPGVIENTYEKNTGTSQTTFSLLYTVYSYPNTVLPIFGGIFLDMVGLR